MPWIPVTVESPWSLIEGKTYRQRQTQFSALGPREEWVYAKYNPQHRRFETPDGSMFWTDANEPVEVWEEETLSLPSGESPTAEDSSDVQAQIHSVPTDDLIIVTGDCSEAYYVLCIPADGEKIPPRFTFEGQTYEIKRVATPNTEEERR